MGILRIWNNSKENYFSDISFRKAIDSYSRHKNVLLGISQIETLWRKLLWKISDKTISSRQILLKHHQTPILLRRVDFTQRKILLEVKCVKNILIIFKQKKMSLKTQ